MPDGPGPGVAAQTRDVYHGNVGSVVNAEVFSGTILTIMSKARASVLAHSFGADSIRRLEAVYEFVPEWERAVRLLRERRAVALVGEPGSGRQITAVNLAYRNGLTPHMLYLEPEDVRAQLPMEQSTALLLDLSDLDRDALEPRTGTVLLSHAQALAGRGSALIILATSREWRLLDMAQHHIHVEMGRPPDPVRVFRRHLGYLADQDLADRCAARPEIITALTGAVPADAAELAAIAAASTERESPPDVWTADAIEAYRKWPSRIADWFGSPDNDDGYRRSLLLATAALEGASTADVFAAANQLAALVQLPRHAGAPLTGPGVSALIAAIGAREENGRIRFTRTRYAVSVLDHVWLDRPHLRDDLQTWLIALARGATERAALSASTLAGLATRHHEPNRVAGAVIEWARNASLRSLAVEVLTLAAVDDEIGREIRRTMYYWAARVTTDEGLATVVARVCGGDLGRAFPSIAMTRLHHLAGHESSAVHAAVVAALVQLAQDPRLRPSVLREVTSWFLADQPRWRQATAREAFVALATLRDEKDRIVMLLGAADREAYQDALADGWRACLRDQDPVKAEAAQAALRQWLEAVARHGRFEPVIEILARSCKSSIDVAALSAIVSRWSRAVGGPVAIERRVVGDRLRDRIDQRDPLRTRTRLAGAVVGRGGIA